MTGYTKLFNSILTSTIWCQDSDTKVVWITLLASADAQGVVELTVPGLAKLAGVSLDKVREAITYFEGPDPESRSVNNGGSRLTRVNNGWQLVNYGKYRVSHDKQHRKQYMRDYMRNYRNTQRLNARPVSKPLTGVNTDVSAQLAVLAQAEAYNTTPYNPPSKVNFVNKLVEEQNFKSKIQNPKPKIESPRNCMMPGCGKPVDSKHKPFCSQACKDYAEFLNSKHGPSA